MDLQDSTLTEVIESVEEEIEQVGSTEPSSISNTRKQDEIMGDLPVTKLRKSVTHL